MNRRTRCRRAADHPSKTSKASAETHAKSTRKSTRSRSRGGSGGEGDPSSRAFWKGSIAFGLVQIPVRLVTAERSDDLSFHQVDRRDMARIRYKRVNEETGDEVAWAEIGKAYELDDGDLVLLDEEDFEKANVEASRTIDIQDFVKRADIPPEFFARSYYLVPEKASRRAYAVLRAAMQEAERAAVAMVVLRTRQHLAAIVAEGDALRLELLHFVDELVPVKSIAGDLPGDAKVTEKEAAVAAQLVEGLAAAWDPKRYKDTYKEDLLKAIAKKAKTGKLAPAHAAKSIPRAGHADLLALLEKSVARTSSKGASPKPRAKGAKKKAA